MLYLLLNQQDHNREVKIRVEEEVQAEGLEEYWKCKCFQWCMRWYRIRELIGKYLDCLQCKRHEDLFARLDNRLVEAEDHRLLVALVEVEDYRIARYLNMN